MAQHFKSLDQQHPVTVGGEGFWGERDAFRQFNPGMPASDWAANAGQVRGRGRAPAGVGIWV